MMENIAFLFIQIFIVLIIVEGMVGKPVIKPIIEYTKLGFELAATLTTVFLTLSATLVGLALKFYAFLRDFLKKR